MTDIEKHVIGEALWWSYYSDDGPAEQRWIKYPITRVTASRVYYMNRDRETYTDRAKLVARGWCNSPGGGHNLYLEGPEESARRQEERRQAWLVERAGEVSRLRQEAANAHPDRGGTAEAFRDAYARYTRAKQQQGGGIRV